MPQVMAYHFDDSRGWGKYDSTMIVGGGGCFFKLHATSYGISFECSQST